MTIEIRQLVIRAVVDVRSDSSSSVSSTGVKNAEPERDVQPASEPELDRQALINACVREVLRKLERARER